GDTNHTNGWLHDTETDHNCQHTNSNNRLKFIIREEMQIEVINVSTSSSQSTPSSLMGHRHSNTLTRQQKRP
ncbi:hypothetical protein Tco_1040626, partial [Tanacetum coccineum]